MKVARTVLKGESGGNAADPLNVRKNNGNGMIRESYYIGDKVGYVKQAGQPKKITATGAVCTLVYDNLDRLTGVQQNGAGPHVLTEVENTGGLLNTKKQVVEYNAFDRVSFITDTVANDAYRLDVTYGPDSIFYAHKDHLGSIVKITTGAGSTVFAADYDAWGRRTVTTGTFNFHRGFTGHEHLPEFGLINMNARLYDPLVGRFLSPDPYVQMPDFSQSFNRYSYCLNNPLIYTDPSGELFIIYPTISWSKEGGVTFGLNAILGIPGICSIQGGISYNKRNNDFSAFVGATAMFNTVYVSHSSQSGWSTGWSAGISPQMGFPISTNFTSMGVNYNITHGSWSGNLSAWTVDKSGWSFNPSISVMIEPERTTNLVRGQGFRSNDQVLSRFVDNGQQQKALDYFGFKGTYDPSVKNPGQLDPNDGSIKYNDIAFSKNYDYLRAVYSEELFHSKDYLTYKSKMPTDISNEHAYEEYRAQVHLYKIKDYTMVVVLIGDKESMYGALQQV